MRLRKTIISLPTLVQCITAGASGRKYMVEPRSGETNTPPASPEEEAQLAMDKIKHTVESAGLAMDDVVSIPEFCTDQKLYDTFNGLQDLLSPRLSGTSFSRAAKLRRGREYGVMGTAVKRSSDRCPALVRLDS